MLTQIPFVFTWQTFQLIHFSSLGWVFLGKNTKIIFYFSTGPLSEKQEALITKSPASNTRRPEDRSLGPMLPTTKAILRDFYRPFNTKLAQVLFDDAFLWKRT